jgi:phage gp36-like protein
MTYATQQDMIDRFGSTELIELTDRANLGSIDTTVLGRALADADAEINGYLASRYTLPLLSVPPVLVAKACDIARYYLYDVRVTEAVKARYDDAVSYMQSLAKGLVSLGLDPVNVPVVVAGGVQVQGGTRVFSADNLSDY